MRLVALDPLLIAVEFSDTVQPYRWQGSMAIPEAVETTAAESYHNGSQAVLSEMPPADRVVSVDEVLGRMTPYAFRPPHEDDPAGERVAVAVGSGDAEQMATDHTDALDHERASIASSAVSDEEEYVLREQYVFRRRTLTKSGLALILATPAEVTALIDERLRCAARCQADMCEARKPSATTSSSFL